MALGGPARHSRHGHRPRTCTDVEDGYAALVAANRGCSQPTDCQLLIGQCSVGLGGCYEFVNHSITQSDLSALGQEFSSLSCTTAVCDCAPPPGVTCSTAGECVPDVTTN